MKKFILAITSLLFLYSCNQSNTTDQQANNSKASEKAANQNSIEVVTLLGDTIFNRTDQSGEIVDKYLSAKADYSNNPDSAEFIIWYGRRAAYLGSYNEAIKIYTEGISKHPNDARFYRHRGHRYLTKRMYKKAALDFEKASELIQGKQDQIEPDGIPNKLNTPVSTLQSNIWYHLGLAYFLQNDLDNALRSYKECVKVSTNDDMIVSTAHWYYMTLRRLNKNEEANTIIAEVSSEMNIIENQSYQRLCLFYKGELTEENLQNTESGNPANDAVLYGLANWFLSNGHKEKAKLYYEKIISGGNKASFGYLAAEVDYLREF